MVADNILQRIRALANMTTDRGASEAEAQTALEKMQKLLFEHNLSIADIDLRNDVRPKSNVTDVFTSAWQRENRKPGSGFKERSRRLPPYEREWRCRLAAALARVNFCSVLYGGGWNGVFFVGSPENIEVVQEIWHYAIEQIDRLSYEALKARRKNDLQRALEYHESGKTWRKSWLFGCVDRVSARLYETWNELRKASEKSTALVISNAAAITAYEEEKWPTLYTKKRRNTLKASSTYGAGYNYGYAAGDRVDINRPTKKLAGG